MLKKIIAFSFLLISSAHLEAQGGYYTDRDGCLHEVRGSWEHQKGWSIDYIKQCPNPNDPKNGSSSSKSWDYRQPVHKQESAQPRQLPLDQIIVKKSN